jgi:hypothetical protein
LQAGSPGISILFASGDQEPDNIQFDRVCDCLRMPHSFYHYRQYLRPVRPLNVSPLDWPRPGQTRAGQTRAGQTRAGQTRAGPTRAGQTRAGPTRAGQTFYAFYRLHQIWD